MEAVVFPKSWYVFFKLNINVALNMSDVSRYMNCVHKNWENLRFFFLFAKSAETLVIKE
jgi:hypothetical protein